MEKELLTPRLRLTLLETADDDSLDLQKMHRLRSSPELTIWSIAGTSKSLQQTQDFVRGHVLAKKDSPGPERYRTSYLIHTRPDNTNTNTNTNNKTDANTPQEQADLELSTLVGTVGLKECQPYPGGAFAPHLTVQDPQILKLEVGYGFLPSAWGKGYAAEALSAFLDAFSSARSVWSPPFESVYFEAVIGPANPRSQRVAEKVGFRYRGDHVWEGEDTWIGGGWQAPRIMLWGCGSGERERERKIVGDGNGVVVE